MTQNFIEVGVVAGEFLKVRIAELVAGPDDDGCTQLEGAFPRIALSIPFGQSSRPGRELAGAGKSHFAQGASANELGGRAVFVEEHFERNRFILDESLRIAASAGTDSGDVRTCCEDLLISLTDLTGPFPAGQSAEVSEEEDDPGVGRPAVAEPLFGPFRIDQVHRT